MTKREAKRRNIEKIILHCSATPPGRDIGAEEIRAWHKGRGWADIGYHYVIRRDGSLEPGREEQIIGAHTRGFNHGSIGICLVGGTSTEGAAQYNFTDAQMVTVRALTLDLLARYEGAGVHGHKEFSGKACPTFDVSVWAEGLT